MTSTSPNRAFSRHVWRWDDDGRLVLHEENAPIVSGVHRDSEALDQFRALLPPREADLLDIATAVFGSDRIAPRPPGGAGRGDHAHYLDWRREIHLEIPVREPRYWRDRRVAGALQHALGELTADLWRFDYVSAPPSRGSFTQLRLPHTRDDAPAALFSGGLDSLAGVLLYIREHKKIPWLVSVASNSHVASQQKALVRLLAQDLSEMPESQTFTVYNIGQEPRDLGKKQRARSFLYFVIASLLARRVGTHDILILENGITSLNVPISPFLTSTRTTRTTHPLAITAFEEMARHVLEWPDLRLLSPFVQCTKAEMVKRVGDAKNLVAKTVSCARVRTDRWCGACTACILRRQTLWAAGLSDIDEEEARQSYGHNIFDDFSADAAVADRRWYFLATLDHILRILRDDRALAFEPSVIRLAVARAESTGNTAEHEMKEIVQLHHRYALEWVEVLNKAQHRYPNLRPIANALQARRSQS